MYHTPSGSNQREMSLLVYQPINTSGSNGRRCLSASHAFVSKVTPSDIETMSLPGQLDSRDAVSNFIVSTELQPTNETLHPNHSGCVSSSTLNPSCTNTNSYHPPASDAMLVSDELPVESTSPQSIVGRSSISQTSLEIQGLFGQASKMAWVEETSTHASPLVHQPDEESIQLSLPNKQSVHNQSLAPKNCCKYCLYFFIALIVYPILILLLPLLLMVKLLSLLLCCIPCKKYSRGSTVNPQTPPHFFDSQLGGGFHSAVVVLKERMTRKKFLEHVVSKMQEAYQHSDHNDAKFQFVLQLASQASKFCCFTWRETLDRVELDQHIRIVEEQMSTTNDLMYFLTELSKEEAWLDTEWMVYFIEQFHGHSSAVVVRAHHTLVSKIQPKSTLINTFTTTSEFSFSAAANSHESLRLSPAIKFCKGPGVVLSNMLNFSWHRLFRSERLSGRLRFAMSEPFSLASLSQVVKEHDVSVYAVFLAALTHSFRALFRHQNKSSRNVTFAIPVHHDSHTSAFFVTLPAAQGNESHAHLLRNLEEQILRNKEDALVFLSAAKLGSYLLFPSILNSIASSIVKQAYGMFNVIDCSNHSLYFEDSQVILSVAFWPPLFHKLRIGVSILQYRHAFRVCIVTDQNVTDWPDLFVTFYLSALYNLNTIIPIT